MENKELIKKLKKEQDELKHRLDKLLVFLNKQKEEQTVSDYQLDLLHRQWLHMQGYENILDLRIDDLNRK